MNSTKSKILYARGREIGIKPVASRAALLNKGINKCMVIKWFEFSESSEPVLAFHKSAGCCWLQFNYRSIDAAIKQEINCHGQGRTVVCVIIYSRLDCIFKIRAVMNNCWNNYRACLSVSRFTSHLLRNVFFPLYLISHVSLMRSTKKFF